MLIQMLRKILLVQMHPHLTQQEEERRSSRILSLSLLRQYLYQNNVIDRWISLKGSNHHYFDVYVRNQILQSLSIVKSGETKNTGGRFSLLQSNHKPVDFVMSNKLQ